MARAAPAAGKSFADMLSVSRLPIFVVFLFCFRIENKRRDFLQAKHNLWTGWGCELWSKVIWLPDAEPACNT